MKDPSLYKRLKYAKDILLQMIHKNAKPDEEEKDMLYSTRSGLSSTRKVFTEQSNTKQKTSQPRGPLYA
jgi:hypothetical protein